MPVIEYKKPYIVELAKTLKSHWYSVWLKNKKGEKGRFLGHYPSATTILNAYPQSEHLTRWIAEQGWNESQAIKSAAGERGTNVHSGIEMLLGGAELIEGGFAHGMHRPFSLEEWHKLTTFVAWYEAYKPEILALEVPVFSKKGGYAGRLDCLAKMSDGIYVLDWKTSGSIHENFALQFAAYAHAIEENSNIKIEGTAAIQMGAKNKDGYRYVVYPNWKEHYEVFSHVKATWQYDNFDSKKNAKEAPILVVPSKLKLTIGEGKVESPEK